MKNGYNRNSYNNMRPNYQNNMNSNNNNNNMSFQRNSGYDREERKFSDKHSSFPTNLIDMKINKEPIQIDLTKPSSNLQSNEIPITITTNPTLPPNFDVYSFLFTFLKKIF